MGIYIPNLDEKAFNEICEEKGLQFVYISVPPHGRLIIEEGEIIAED